jgi:hypothetical protein
MMETLEALPLSTCTVCEARDVIEKSALIELASNEKSGDRSTKK